MQNKKVTEVQRQQMYDFFFNYYKKNVYVKSRPYPGIKRLLKRLKQEYQLAVCSNKMEKLTKIVLHK